MNKNKYLYDKKYYQASRRFQLNNNRMEEFISLIKESNPTKVLDVGCGIGTLVKKLNQEGLETIGIDFSDELEDFWEGDNFFEMDAKQIDFPDKSFDVVFSSDFFEHLDEEGVDSVASEMKRVGKRVICFVADNIGEVLAGRQLRYHLTHKPLAWWKEKLEGIEVYSSHI
jgi:ubiquinone/menaquinone biosynthesis C-methylase UbiE